MCCLFLFTQKTAYDMRIRNWSSGVCSSDRLPRSPGLSGAPLRRLCQGNGPAGPFPFWRRKSAQLRRRIELKGCIGGVTPPSAVAKLRCALIDEGIEGFEGLTARFEHRIQIGLHEEKYRAYRNLGRKGGG